MSFIRDGDTLVVTKLDRLARSVTHMGEIVQRLRSTGVALRILNLGIDTGTATGELMLNVLASVAQLEGSMMLERQRKAFRRQGPKESTRAGLPPPDVRPLLSNGSNSKARRHRTSRGSSG